MVRHALTVIVLANATAISGVGAQQPATRWSLVFDHVTVVDVETGKLVPNRRVVVSGNRVVKIEVARAGKLPSGAQVIDARGKYLIPGMWDLHVHPREFVDIAFPLFIANGVTGVRDAGSPVPLSTMVQWKREIAAGTRVGPRYLVSGPAIDQGEGDSIKLQIQNGYGYLKVPPALAVHAVDSLRAAGADFIKTYGMLSPMWFTVAAEARRLGMLFGGHLPYDGSLSAAQASDSGASFVDHHFRWDNSHDECKVQSADSARVASCLAAAEAVGVRVLERNNAWIPSLRFHLDTASLALRAALVRRYYPRSMQEQGPVREQLAFLPASVDTVDRILSATPTSTAGWRAVGLVPSEADNFMAHEALSRHVVGTDVGYGVSTQTTELMEGAGFGVPRTLLYFVLDGMTTLEALQAATINPVKALRATDSLGTVVEGKLADLVLLDADPLQDIWNTSKVRAVVANGRYFDRVALDQLLQEVATRARKD